jgi:hypothetical protein
MAVVAKSTKSKPASAQAVITMHVSHPQLNEDSKRAAIKAALLSATKGLAAAALTGAQRAVAEEGDAGTPPPPPWGEVIIGPIWEESGGGGNLREAALTAFWQW